MQQMMPLIAGVNPSVGFSTWNSADKTGSVTLSSGNKVATTSTSGGQGVRGTLGKSTGNWYCEVTTSGATTECLIGVSPSSTGVNQCGDNALEYGYYRTGQRYTGGSLFAYGASYTTGDIIGIQYNGGQINYWKNGVDQGSAITGLSGLYYPHFSTAAAGSPANVGTLNTGETAFAYSLPSGASAWG